VAASLRNEPGIAVEVIDGNHGEFTVSVDGRVVAQKDKSLPEIADVLKAVRQAPAVGAVV